MRTLGEVVDRVKSNKPVTEEELIYSVIALESLNTFDSLSLMRICEAKADGKVHWLTGNPKWEYKESFERTKLAFSKPPKEWVGWNNDPKNPEYRKMRQKSIKLADKIIDKMRSERKGKS